MAPITRSQQKQQHHELGPEPEPEPGSGSGVAAAAPPELTLPSFDSHTDLGEGDNSDPTQVAQIQRATNKSDQPQSDAPAPAAARSSDAISARSGASSRKSRRRDDDPSDEPPRFTIDLSLPPEERYEEVCTAFQSEIANLTPLFDEVVGGALHYIPLNILHRLSRLMLRRVYDREENAELEGISKATGVSMYLLVCFNVLLDLLVGCSSGGAAVKDGDEGESKMLHFRTLDWNMDSLRKVVVQLDFVLEKDGPVFASSVTYAGYVGVLTGVREGLSISLNYRPNRVDNGVLWSDAKYNWHKVCVLLGWKRSISSTLRTYLLPSCAKSWVPFAKAPQGSKDNLPDYKAVVKEMGGDEDGGKPPITTTACYLCFSDGKETTVIEKDRIAAKVRSGDEFVVVTNTDESPPTTPEPQTFAAKTSGGTAERPIAQPTANERLATVLAEAQDRQDCVLHNWRSLQSSRRREQGLYQVTAKQRKQLADVKDVVKLVQRFPTTNECTQFAVVMDPGQGKGEIVWCRWWKEPVGEKWMREHMGGMG